jgi:hypothetical protein
MMMIIIYHPPSQLSVFDTHPRSGMVVPKFLQHSGHILDSGGLVFSDGSGWQVLAIFLSLSTLSN